MSHEYSRIPLSKGLNIICGPNGSGKSSILLGISVCLGQSYTERSRKLTDLIRRGKDIARVSLIFDNKPINGNRPLKFTNSDSFMISRYIRSDGSYWFEADYKEISKAELSELLNQMGINPENMLIIMHQGMIEEFALTSPQDKLKMLEEAVGFKEYREKIIEARERLKGLIDEEVKLGEFINKAGETLEYWKEIYNKFLLRKGLLERKIYLERELAWAKVIKQENGLKILKERVEKGEKRLNHLQNRIDRLKLSFDEISKRLNSDRMELNKLFFSLAKVEGEKGNLRGRLKSLEEFLNLLNVLAENINKISEKLTQRGSLDLKTYKSYYERDYEEIKVKLSSLEKEINSIQSDLEKMSEKLTFTLEKYSNLKAELELKKYQFEFLKREISRVKEVKEREETILKELTSNAEDLGERIETSRNLNEIQEEIKVLEVQIKALGDIPEQADKIYTDYSTTYEELKERLRIVLDNKNKALKEVEDRKEVWKKVIEELLEKVELEYKEFLSSLNADGSIKFVNSDDIDKAGLELYVGFKDSPPTLLNGLTHSGGERSVVISTFLLALQKSILSPIRAIDEFDIHMDPLNREAMMRMFFKGLKGLDCQYLVITPSQISFLEEEAQILMVQMSPEGTKVSAL